MHHMPRIGAMLGQHFGGEMSHDVLSQNKIVSSVVGIRRTFSFDQIERRMLVPEHIEHTRAKVHSPVGLSREAQEIEKASVSAANFEDADRMALAKKKPQLLRKQAERFWRGATALRAGFISPELAIFFRSCSHCAEAKASIRPPCFPFRGDWEKGRELNVV